MKKIYKFLLCACLLSTMNTFGMESSKSEDYDNVNTPTVEQRNETEHQQNWWEEKEPTTIQLTKHLTFDGDLKGLITRRVLRDYIRNEVTKKTEKHWTKTTMLVKNSLESITHLTTKGLELESEWRRDEVRTKFTWPTDKTTTKQFLELWDAQSPAQRNGIVYFNAMRMLKQRRADITDRDDCGEKLNEILTTMVKFASQGKFKQEVEQAVSDVRLYINQLNLTTPITKELQLKRNNAKILWNVLREQLNNLNIGRDIQLLLEDMVKESADGVAAFTTAKKINYDNVTFQVSLDEEQPYNLTILNAKTNAKTWDGTNDKDAFRGVTENLIPSDKENNKEKMENESKQQYSKRQPNKTGLIFARESATNLTEMLMKTIMNTLSKFQKDKMDRKDYELSELLTEKNTQTLSTIALLKMLGNTDRPNTPVQTDTMKYDIRSCKTEYGRDLYEGCNDWTVTDYAERIVRLYMTDLNGSLRGVTENVIRQLLQNMPELTKHRYIIRDGADTAFNIINVYILDELRHELRGKFESLDKLITEAKQIRSAIRQNSEKNEPDLTRENNSTLVDKPVKVAPWTTAVVTSDGKIQFDTKYPAKINYWARFIWEPDGEYNPENKHTKRTVKRREDRIPANKN